KREEGELAAYILPVDQMFTDYPAVSVLAEYDGLVHNGNRIKAEQLNPANKADLTPCIRVYDSAGMFIGIYEQEQEPSDYKPRKVFLGGQ
ncbi:MAG: tRNA pseudouridine(55) synthase, partial [Hungatella sp.]